jgi:DNA-binding transcriptional LysR family regulator
MPLEAIKIFCDLADRRSFSKTAEANDVSQPTVSRVLKQLEDRLGGTLIDRSRRPFRLTPLGEAYYEGCRRLLDQYAELEASLMRSHAPRSVSVRVAAIYSVGLWDMGQYVERCEALHPHAKIHIDYLHPNAVYQRVLEGTAELGLVSFPTATREILVQPWREEEMVVVCTPGHPLARRERVRPLELDGLKYVSFDGGLAIRREVDRFLHEQGVKVEVALEFDNIENIKKGIEVGGGVALLPEPMIRQERQAGTLVGLSLEGAGMVRPLGIIHRRQHQLCSAALGFIELLQASAEAHPNPPCSRRENGEVAGGSAPKAGLSGERTSRGATRAHSKKVKK